jgi:anti-sigma B factor antagonist
MLEIKFGENAEIILSGRFDASQAATATAVFDSLTEPRTVDLRELDYISSMGLAILLKTQKRLIASSGAGLKLVNVNPHINDIFRYSGFNQVFEIQTISS